MKATILSALVLQACAPVCSVSPIGDDVVMTARHCQIGSGAGAGTEIASNPVAVGDTVVLSGMCSGTHVGHVVAIEGRVAVTDSAVCPGDSGGPVLDAGGKLIGIVVRMRLPNRSAIVELIVPGVGQ